MSGRDVTTRHPLTFRSTGLDAGRTLDAPAGTAASAVDDGGRAWLCLYRAGVYYEAHVDWHDVANVLPPKRTPAPKPDRAAIDARKVATARRMLEKANARLAAVPRPSATPNDPAIVNLPMAGRNLDRDIMRGAALDRMQAEAVRRAGMLASLLTPTS